MAIARTPTTQASKSILATLRISNEKAPNNSAYNAPQKFSDTVDKQIEYVGMEMRGEDLPMQGGEQRQITPRRWYWEKGGEWYITVQYGNMKMDITGNRKLLAIKDLEAYKTQARSTVHAGKSLEDVEKVLQSLKKATIDTKELVPYIDHLAMMIGQRLEKARASH